MKNKIENDSYENCVLCHCRTSVPRELPIDRREYYVSGVGQLCAGCHDTLILEEDDKKHR